MPDKKPCSHPQMCPPEDSFQERIKREKLSLEPPPPTEAMRDKNRR
jgi:hypothetical protein